MDIKALYMIEGARQVVGLRVIIDVFRAFPVEVYLFYKGAKGIIQVGDMNIAYKLKEENDVVGKMVLHT